MNRTSSVSQAVLDLDSFSGIGRLKIVDNSNTPEEVPNESAHSKIENNTLFQKRRRRRMKRAGLPVESIPKSAKGKNITIKKTNNEDSCLSDLRDLIFGCLYGKRIKLPEGRSLQSNLKIKGRTSVKRVIAVFVPGLQSEDLGLPPCTRFRDVGPFALMHSRLFPKRSLEQRVKGFPISSPGCEASLYPAYNYFVNRRLSRKEREIRHQKLRRKNITINDLLMSLDELVEQGCPIHPSLLIKSARKLNTDGEMYVNTRKFDHAGSHIFALDCEMCLCTEEYVLTKITIADFDGNIIYNHLVKPDVPITDYLTQYSGITEEKLSNVTTTLRDVQHDLLSMISEDDILVGHSLAQDLNALKVCHPKLVDTCVIYEHRSGPPFKPSLRYLVSTHLKDDIQNSHGDLREDARACMDLVKMKLHHGLAFGISGTTVNIYRELSNAGIKWIKLDEDVFEKRRPPAIDFDAEIFQHLIDSIGDNRFMVARLKGLALSRDYPCGLSMAPNRVMKEEKLPNEKESLSVLSSGLTELYQKVPEGTMIAIISGNGDSRLYSRMLAEFEVMNQERKGPKERPKGFEEAASKAKDGVALFLFKQKAQRVNKLNNQM